MRTALGFLLLTLLAMPCSAAGPAPDWAYPVPDKVPPPKHEDDAPRQMPGSTRQYTPAQINDRFNPPDWYPDEHPPMPSIVAHGSKPTIAACALCHLPTGAGHPESSGLAGLPVAYTVRQMQAFKTGERRGVRTTAMATFAKAIADEDVRAAAEYFAGLKGNVWTKVVETDTVPKTYVGEGAMRFPLPDAGSEPIGMRIIELPQDPARAASRDAHSGFVAYVPAGSIAKGKALVTTGGGKTVACGVCHGEHLTGLAEFPGIAGRSPIYTVRQLYDIQSGNRTGTWVELMQGVVKPLDIADMVAIAAYLGSLEP